MIFGTKHTGIYMWVKFLSRNILCCIAKFCVEMNFLSIICYFQCYVSSLLESWQSWWEVIEKQWEFIEENLFFFPFHFIYFPVFAFSSYSASAELFFLKIMEKLYLNEPVMIFLIDLQLSCHGDWCCFSQIWEAEIEVQRDVASPEGQLPSLKSQPAAGLSCAPCVPRAYQSSLSWWCWTVNRKDVFSSLTRLLLCNLRVASINSLFYFYFSMFLWLCSRVMVWAGSVGQGSRSRGCPSEQGSAPAGLRPWSRGTEQIALLYLCPFRLHGLLVISVSFKPMLCDDQRCCRVSHGTVGTCWCDGSQWAQITCEALATGAKSKSSLVSAVLCVRLMCSGHTQSQDTFIHLRCVYISLQGSEVQTRRPASVLGGSRQSPRIFSSSHLLPVPYPIYLGMASELSLALLQEHLWILCWGMLLLESKAENLLNC